MIAKTDGLRKTDICPNRRCLDSFHYHTYFISLVFDWDEEAVIMLELKFSRIIFLAVCLFIAFTPPLSSAEDSVLQSYSSNKQV